MEFSSLLFIYVILPVSLLVYSVTPEKVKNAVLLVLSILLCATVGLEYLAVTAGFAVISYLLGLLIHKTGKIRAVSAIFLGIGILAGVFMFIVFRTELVTFPESIVSLPMIGLSYILLNSTGYHIDIFRGKIAPEKNLFSYLLYILFFAKLSAGPVISYGSFRRILAKRRHSLSETGAGLSLFAIGLAKKVIFADNFYELYSAVKSIDVYELSAVSAWLGLGAYIMCLYFTLSGMADMGAGVARCFGIKLPRSFRYPLFSYGVRDFCRRWHMPVMRWFSRYTAKPVYKAISNPIEKNLLIITVCGVMGVWYGRGINSFIWGILIGVSCVLEIKNSNRKSGRLTAYARTFFVMNLCWIFFMGSDPVYSFKYLLALLGGNNILTDSLSSYLLSSYTVIIFVGIIISTGAVPRLINKSRKKAVRVVYELFTPVFVTALLLICTALITYSGVSQNMIIIL
ncbi:MAG: MBOAT family protein [Ruminococcus sp.]|nr:MBOAT family protein [Ruminococcus sp.]